MADWLSKMFGSPAKASSEPRGTGSVRDALQNALRNRCKVHLEAPDQGIVALTQVQQINAEEIVIDQPAVGGNTYPLAFGESLKISFVDQKTNLTGRTKCLGRVKVPAGEGRTLFAYRLSMPTSLSVEERRTQPRAELVPEVAPEAQLYAGTLTAPLTGKLTNISMSGARVTLTNPPPRELVSGGEVYLKFQMIEPVGVVDEVVRIERLSVDRRSGAHTVGVSFQRRLDRLETLMRLPPERLAMPAPQPTAAQRKSA